MNFRAFNWVDSKRLFTVNIANQPQKRSCSFNTQLGFFI